MGHADTDVRSVAIILGAGFSVGAGVPLASQLFEHRPDMDRLVRQRLVDRVVTQWSSWRSRTNLSAEEYLAELARSKLGEWHDAVWFVGLTIASRMGELRPVGGRLQLAKHYLGRRSTAIHECFWTTVFRQRTDVSVITTNYDILPERGLRCHPRPRVDRPGFNYGFGPEDLAGRGYPYTHARGIQAAGHVPLLKLHGSVSWSVENGVLVKYHDCRPAIRGDAAIVAPIAGKSVPPYLQPTWRAAKARLSNAPTWIVVGYSLPAYDRLIQALLHEAATPGTTIHVFDPDPTVAERFRAHLPELKVHAHPGLPEGTDAIPSIL